MSIASLLAPAGTLRVGVWTVPYFAVEHAGALKGIVPDLGNELARRAGVREKFVRFENPGKIIEAFRNGALDVTFLGITAERAEAIEFGPVLFELQTTYLVPASSAIASMAEIDRPGIRILVPARSAQEAHLTATIKNANLVPVAAETPKAALAMLAAGDADAFSHVAPMLASIQPSLPGSLILPGSYFNVPIAIGVAKGRPPAVVDFARTFAEDAKTSGLVQELIAHLGAQVTGLTVAT